VDVAAGRDGPDEPTYNNTWAVWLDGALEVSALQQAWDAVVARHEALRTTFRNEAGVPVQVIEEEPASPSGRFVIVAGLTTVAVVLSSRLFTREIA